MQKLLLIEMYVNILPEYALIGKMDTYNIKGGMIVLLIGRHKGTFQQMT